MRLHDTPSLLLLTALTCTIAAGCGSGPQSRAAKPAQPAAAKPALARGPADPEQAAPAPRAGAPAKAPAPVTRAECEALLDHVVALAYAEHTAKVPAEYVPTSNDVVAIRAELAPEFIRACTSLSRSAYECERAAKSREELLACSPSGQ